MMKRFYKEVSVQKEGQQFAILLDNKPVKTKLGKPLALRHAKLAQAIAGEWRAQGEKIEIATMPLTGFASAVIDHLPHRREEMMEDLTAYADTDLVCMRVPEMPPLLARQEAILDPLIEWMKERYEITLIVQRGLMPVTQLEGNRETLKALLSSSDKMGDWQFIPLYYLTKALGSIVLALAVVEKRLSGEQAFAASRLEEDFQAEHWGSVDDAEDAAEAIKDDILEACKFLEKVNA